MDIGSSPILVVHNGFNTILKLQWNFCILKGVSVYKQCIFFMKFENTVIVKIMTGILIHLCCDSLTFFFFKFHESQQKQHTVYKLKHLYNQTDFFLRQFESLEKFSSNQRCIKTPIVISKIFWPHYVPHFTVLFYLEYELYHKV